MARRQRNLCQRGYIMNRSCMCISQGDIKRNRMNSRLGMGIKKMPVGGPVTGDPDSPGALNWARNQLTPLYEYGDFDNDGFIDDNPQFADWNVQRGILGNVGNTLNAHMRGRGMTWNYEQHFRKGGRIRRRKRRRGRR